VRTHERQRERERDDETTVSKVAGHRSDCHGEKRQTETAHVRETQA
jgi:hypothetical protein